jgi:hypothetical protein
VPVELFLQIRLRILGVQYADHGAAPEDEGLSLRDDPSLRHFHFVHTAKREKELY